MSKTDWCRNCKNGYFDSAKGFCCKLTQEAPAFTGVCPHLEIDGVAAANDLWKRTKLEGRQCTMERRRRAVLCRQRGIHGNFAFVLFLLLASAVFPVAIGVVGLKELFPASFQNPTQILSLLAILSIITMSVYTFVSVLKRKPDAILLLIFYGIFYLIASFGLLYNFNIKILNTPSFISSDLNFMHHYFIIYAGEIFSIFIFLFIVISASASLQVWAFFPPSRRRKASWFKWIKVLLFSAAPLALFITNLTHLVQIYLIYLDIQF